MYVVAHIYVATDKIIAYIMHKLQLEVYIHMRDKTHIRMMLFYSSYSQ